MRFSILTLAICLVLGAPAVHALSSDRNQPATIEADEVEFDFRTGKRTYKGNVVVIQGTLRVTGDKMVVQYSNEGQQIESATTWGEPATFKQRPDGKEHDVYGEGQEIILNEIENTLTLIDDALMRQAGNTAKGRKIIYDMASDKMTVKGLKQQQQQQAGDGGDATQTEDGRARVIITPGEQQTAGSDASGTGNDSGENESSGDAGASGADQDAE